jgi:lysozyme
MKLSTAGRGFIKGFEGLSLKAYRDADGYSIGYGHFGAQPGQVISAGEADRLFDLDVAKFESGVSQRVPVASQHQFDAMVCLAYNIGVAGFASSTVAKQHAAGNYAAAGDAFLLWNKSQGRILPVLKTRRAL